MTDRGPALEGASRVAASVHLRDMRLVQLEFELQPIQPDPPFDVRLNAEANFHQQGTALIYTVAFSVGAFTSPDPDADELFSCRIGYLVHYETEEEEEFSDDALETFGQVSVLFSTYPYLRELVQSLTARAGLIPLVLDVIRSPMALIPRDGHDLPEGVVPPAP